MERMIEARNVRIARLSEANGPTEVIEVAGVVMIQQEDWDEPCVVKPPPGCRNVTLTGEFVFRSRVEWLRTWQLVAGIKPSIKYGEHRWGAFA